MVKTSCLLLTHVLILSSVKSIIYHLFSILKSILYTIIFVSITCKYIPYRILLQKQSERLVMTSFILISPSPLLAYSPLASPAQLPLTLPVSITAAANTANNLFTHIYHCFTVTCFNGGFVSSFECRWGYVRAAFGAAGPGGRGVADRWAAEEAGPAEGAESNTGNIPGWHLQVWGKYAACC